MPDIHDYSHPTLDKVSNLRKLLGENPAYDADVEQISKWEEQVRELVAREEALENASVQKMLKELSDDVIRMDGDLRTKDSNALSAADRDRLLDKKALYEAFVARFSIKEIRAEIEGVDKEVQENIESLN